MRVLGIETSPRRGSVAWLDAGRVRSRLDLPPDSAGGGAGRSLAPAIDELLRSLGVALEDLDLVAVGIGPGGYTGTRLAVATARALALGAARPVIGIVSTAALAANPALSDGAIVVAIDAKNDEVYAAEYRRRGEEVVEVRAPVVAPAAEIAGWVTAEAALVGDGARRVAAHLRDRAPLRLDDSIHARADEVARLAAARWVRLERDDEARILPLYLRVSEAERRFLERRSGAGP